MGTNIIWLPIITCGIALIILLIFKSHKENKNYNEDITDTDNDQQLDLYINHLRKKALYFFEYKLLPIYIERLKKSPDEMINLIDKSIWKRDVASVIDPPLIDWFEISCEEFGDRNSECLFLYEFPKPFDTPLAKFGAVYINKEKQIYSYFTLELSLCGYMLCSTDVEGHYNYGEREDMSKIRFIEEICKLQKTDETSLQEWILLEKRRSLIKKHMDFQFLHFFTELNDDNYDDFISKHPRAIVCFYSPNCRPSQALLNLLLEFAKEYKDTIPVGKYNVYGTNNESVMTRLNITVMPILLSYQKGEVDQKRIGICDRNTIKMMFEELPS